MWITISVGYSRISTNQSRHLKGRLDPLVSDEKCLFVCHGETQSSVLLRRRCEGDGGHHFPKGKETALQAGRREVQEGVKVSH